MLYYILFWTLLGFILHIYIIFGTNLLTGGPARIAVFCLFQYFEEKEYQTESKQNETFMRIFLKQTQSRRLAVDVKEAARKPRGRRVRPPPSWAPVTWLDVGSKSPELYSVRKSRSRRFHSIWTPFDSFLEKTKTRKKTETGTGL